MDVSFRLLWCQIFGLQKIRRFWKLSVSYHECMGLLSLTVAESKDESFLYDFFITWQGFGKADMVQKIKQFLFNRLAKTYKPAEFLPIAHLKVFSVRKQQLFNTSCTMTSGRKMFLLLPNRTCWNTCFIS